jgi:prepilin-type processing-associated H-X9-DG protein
MGVSSGFSVVAWFVLLLGGAGLPVGMPPLPEDATLAKVAPEECLAYISSAGMATPDAKSGNQTEQLLAEPEVRQMAAEIEQTLRRALKQAVPQGQLPPGVTTTDLADTAKLVLTRPLAIYVSDVKVGPTGPAIRGGVVVNCGEDVAKLKALVGQLAKMVPQKLVKEINVGGEKWQGFTTNPDVNLACGFHGNYFIVTMGEGEGKALLKRMGGAPPAWLVKLRKDLPVERVSTVTYVNIKAVENLVLPMMGGPEVGNVLNGLGLENVTTLASVTGMDQKGCVNKILLGIDGEAAGLLSLADAKPLGAADLAVIPRDATFAVAVRVSPEKVYEAILEAAGKIEPRAIEGIQRERDGMRRALGVDLVDDVLKPLGDTWCLYDSPSEGGALSGLTLVVTLKDAKQAAASNVKVTEFFRKEFDRQNKMRQSDRGMFSSLFAMPERIETVKYAGREISVYSPGMFGPPFNPSWCITDKELIVSLHPQGIKAYLSRTADFETLTAAPEVAKLFAGGPGPVKFAYGDSRRVFDVLYPVVLSNVRYASWALQHTGVEINPAIIMPTARAIRPHLMPTVIAARRTTSGIEVDQRGSVPGASLGMVLPAAMGFMMPMTHTARISARRVQSTNNLKQIGLGLLNYESAQGVYPPAYRADKNGKPLLSWRVLILPYVEGDGLYKEFHLDEPWDSPHNKKLISRMPSVYRNLNSAVGGQGKTNYLTVRGKDTIFSGAKGTRIADVTDGTSTTIMTVEAPDDKAVIWTKPDDFEYDEELPMKGLLGGQPGGFNVGFADGSVRLIPASIKPETLKALFMRNDGEAIDQNELDR